jgi:hypothetical protein
MSRTAARITQADLNRLAKAVAAAGGRVAVEIAKDGTIRLVPCDPEKNSGGKAPVTVAEEEEAFL